MARRAKLINRSPREAPAIATQTDSADLINRLNALRESEPDQFTATPDRVEAFVLAIAKLIDFAHDVGDSVLTDAQARYLNEASMRQVRIARTRLDYERHSALETLGRLFRLGTPPQPDGRYDGELVALSTGLLSDPFFEWLTRIYLPWQGKYFDSSQSTGDNVFLDNTWSKATRAFGWPAYRVPSDAPGTVRVFPFRSYIGRGIEDPDTDVLKIDYQHSPNPLPVRRVVDEVVELPGGYMLGKAHMKGLRHIRRVCFFGLTKST